MGRRVARAGVRRSRAAREGHRRRRAHPAGRGRLERQRLFLRRRRAAPGHRRLWLNPAASVGPVGRPVILDCDTGTDDALAIALAALHPELDLLGVTTVWGNHEVAHTADNTLRVLDHLGFVDVPVHAGLAGPYAGRDPALPGGRADLPATLDLPEPTRPVTSTDAVGWLVETLAGGDRTRGPGGDGSVEQPRGRAGQRPAPARARRPAGPPRWSPSACRRHALGGAERLVRPARRGCRACGGRGDDDVVVTMDATFAALLDARRRRAVGRPRDARRHAGGTT